MKLLPPLWRRTPGDGVMAAKTDWILTMKEQDFDYEMNT